jgi:hypothetical protein
VTQKAAAEQQSKTTTAVAAWWRLISFAESKGESPDATFGGIFAVWAFSIAVVPVILRATLSL